MYGLCVSSADAQLRFPAADKKSCEQILLYKQKMLALNQRTGASSSRTSAEIACPGSDNLAKLNVVQSHATVAEDQYRLAEVCFAAANAD